MRWEGLCQWPGQQEGGIDTKGKNIHFARDVKRMRPRMGDGLACWRREGRATSGDMGKGKGDAEVGENHRRWNKRRRCEVGEREDTNGSGRGLKSPLCVVLSG